MDQAQSTSMPASAPKAGLPGIGILLSQAKETVMKRLAFFFTISAIPAVFMFLTTLLGFRQEGVSGGMLSLMSFIQVVLYLLAVVALIMGLGDESMKDWMAAFKKSTSKVLSYFWVSLLVGLLTAVGFMLLVIPGIYLMVVLSMAQFVVILESIKGTGALKKSNQLVKGYWWAVFGRMIILQLVVGFTAMILTGVVTALQSNILLALLTLVLPLLVVPYVMAYNFLIYKALVSIKR